MAGGGGEIGGAAPLGIGGKPTGADIDQEFHGFRVAVFRGDHERGAAVLHPGINRGSVVGKRINDFRPADEGCEQQGRIQTVAVIGSEFRDGPGFVFAHGEHQGRVSLLVLQPRVGVLPEQPGHHLGFVGQHCGHQWCAIVGAGEIDRDSAVEQEIRGVLGCCGGCGVQSGVA